MHDDGYFGERVVERYDESLTDMSDRAAVDPVVELLAELAGDGAALELGIGTGRIALPLAARGVSVHGIELSRAMVAKLREKPGSADIGVTIGDFATARAPGSYRVAYLVFNTIGNLTTRDAQVACFRNVAAHLRPDGCFVIEVGVPDLQRLPPGATRVVFDFGEDHVGIDEYDVATRASSPIISRAAVTDGNSAQHRSAMSFPRSSTSWRSGQGCACANAGPAGSASRSRQTAAHMSRCGKRPKRKHPARRLKADRAVMRIEFPA